MVLLIISMTAAPAVGATTPSRIGSRSLPPASEKTLKKLFDPMLEQLGLHTTRAHLQSLRTYDISKHGRHLAVYVEPIKNSYTDAEYVKNFVTVAQVFLPMVYDRWAGLKSFDVCQEPLPKEHAGREPPPVTQLIVTRSAKDAVDWEHAKLVDVIAAANLYSRAQKNDRDFGVFFIDRLEQQSELKQARAAATGYRAIG